MGTERVAQTQRFITEVVGSVSYNDFLGTEYACLTLIYVEWITLQFFPARKARDYLAAIFNGSSLRHTPPSAADAT